MCRIPCPYRSYLLRVNIRPPEKTGRKSKPFRTRRTWGRFVEGFFHNDRDLTVYKEKHSVRQGVASPSGFSYRRQYNVRRCGWLGYCCSSPEDHSLAKLSTHASLVENCGGARRQIVLLDGAD